jgi:hypothetical protein
MPDANGRFTHYVMTDNATGEEFTNAFAATDFHNIVEGAAAAIADAGSVSYEQAAQQIAIWTRSQEVHKQEFSYRLA